MTTCPTLTASLGSLTIAVGQVADMHQAVLVDADVDKGAEGGDVGHHPLQDHPLLQVGDLADIVAEGCGLETGCAGRGPASSALR